MPGSPNLDDRLAMLEAEVHRQQALVDLAPERPASLGGHRNPRWAITCKKDTGTPYPAEVDQPNTYWVKFLDSTYTETEGDQTPGDTERQTEGATLAHYRDRQPYQYCPEGTEVVVLFDHGRWWILGPAPSNKAECITFTTTEDMGNSESGNALATINDYYRGYDPAEAGFRVYDPQGLFPRALSGAKGKATYDDRSNEYHITECQQMATVCACVTYAAVALTDPTWVPSGVEVMFPIVGQFPTIATVRNTFSDEMAAGTLVIIGWNETDDAWDVLEVKRKQSVDLWARVQAGFTNNNGSVTRTVSVKACLWDGSGEVGAAFDTKTEIRANKDTALFTGYVVCYRVQADATKLIVDDIWDSPIGTIVAVNAVGAIRDGWREIPGIDDHFLKHSDTGLGGTAGSITHLHDAHADHTIANHDALGNHDAHADHTIADHGTDIDCFVDADISAYVDDPTHVGGAAPGLGHAAHSAHDAISAHAAGGGAGFGHAAHSNADHTPEHLKVQFVERFE